MDAEASMSRPSISRPHHPRRRWSWRAWTALGVAVLGVLAAVPLAVLLNLTKTASEGGKTPDDAVQGAIGGLGRWVDNLEGADRYLSDDNHDQLRAQLLDIRGRLLADDPTYAVEAHNYRVTMTDDDSATVTVSLALRWDVTSQDGGVLFQTTDGHDWTFHAELASGFSSGWKVTSFDHPDLCQVYIRC